MTNGIVVTLSIVLAGVFGVSRAPCLVVEGAVLSYRIAILVEHVCVEELTRLRMLAVWDAVLDVIFARSSTGVGAELDAEGHVLEDLDAHVCVSVVAVKRGLYSCVAKVLLVVVAARRRWREVVRVRACNDDLELVSVLTGICSSARVQWRSPEDALQNGGAGRIVAISSGARVDRGITLKICHCQKLGHGPLWRSRLTCVDGLTAGYVYTLLCAGVSVVRLHGRVAQVLVGARR